MLRVGENARPPKEKKKFKNWQIDVIFRHFLEKVSVTGKVTFRYFVTFSVTNFESYRRYRPVTENSNGDIKSNDARYRYVQPCS